MLSATSSTSEISNTPRILACIRCSSRKIKCDRNPTGCASCAKANAICIPSKPTLTRRRRRPDHNLQERLARCEKLLKEYADAASQEQPSPASSAHASVSKEPGMQWKPGKLVVEKGGIRFMDSMLLSTVHDELKAMRESLDDDESTTIDGISSSETMTPEDNAELIMGWDSSSICLEDLEPDASQIFRLWQFYLDRVNPLTKIIHVPTVQPYLAEASSGSPPQNVRALLFAIYTLTTVSMTADECQNILGYSRKVALDRFSTGVRVSLIRAVFLKNADLATVQALVIYLISLKGRGDRHTVWILNGMVIRVAQKMGLHRDGEIFGLSPFETEMRRRIWWQIITVDSQCAMLAGVNNSLIIGNWDTKEPKNINDADLHPLATEPIQDRDGPTEMVFCMVNYQIAKFLVQSPGFEPIILLNEMGITSTGPPREYIEKYRRSVEGLSRAILERFDKYGGPSAGLLHRIAFQTKDMLIPKLNELIEPKIMLDPTEPQPSPRDSAFIAAVKMLEHSIDQCVIGANTVFTWFFRLDFQIDIFAYVCQQLCDQRTGVFVAKAWRLVEAAYQFYPELLNVKQKVYAAIAAFVLKAWKTRVNVVFGASTAIEEVPTYITQLQSLMPPVDLKPEEIPPSRSDSGPEVISDLPSQNRHTTPPEATNITFDPQYLNDCLSKTSLDWDLWSSLASANFHATTTTLDRFGPDTDLEW